MALSREAVNEALQTAADAYRLAVTPEQYERAGLMLTRANALADEYEASVALGLVAPTEYTEADWRAGSSAFPTTDEASPRLALSVAFGSSEAPTEHGWSVSWYDPTSGSWYDFDSCNEAAGLPSIVARLESNARPYPCPRYRVTFEASWEVEA